MSEEIEPNIRAVTCSVEVKMQTKVGITSELMFSSPHQSSWRHKRINNDRSRMVAQVTGPGLGAVHTAISCVTSFFLTFYLLQRTSLFRAGLSKAK